MVQWMSDNSLFKRNKFMTRKKKPSKTVQGSFHKSQLKDLLMFHDLPLTAHS